MQVYTLREVAKKIKARIPDLYVLRVYGFIPEGEVIVRQRPLYTDRQVKEIAEILKTQRTKHKDGSYSVREAAEMLGFRYARFVRQIQIGNIERGAVIRGKLYRYTAEQIDRIKAELETAIKTPQEKDLADGLFTKTQAAAWLEVPRITFASWVNKGRIKQPTHRGRVYNQRYYTLAEVEQMAETLSDYFAAKKSKA